MPGSETRKIAVRSLSRRPAETVLLIIGIALGIGTTAGGVAMVAHLRQSGSELVSSTGYREIVVSTRDSADDMEVPAYRNEAESTVILTGADLEAKSEVPDVQYAYTVARRWVRISNFNFNFNRAAIAQREPPAGDSTQRAPIEGPSTEAQRPGSDNAQADRPTAETGDARDSANPTIGSGANPTIGSGANRSGSEAEAPRAEVPGATAPTDPRGQAGRAGQTEQQGQFRFEIPEYEGPSPALEEVFAVQVTPEFFSAYEIQPARGSLFTQQEIDSQRPVAVVGSTLEKTLYEDGVALDREILIGRTLYRIIGVAEEIGTQYDEYVFYPSFTTGTGGEFAAVLARFGGFATALRFTVHDADRLDEAQSQLQTYFDARYGTGAVVVRTPGTEAKQTIDRNSRLVTIILFLAIAGLLIAAVNVSNILYGRAMRKRKTIGVLKALGATRQSVFRLFLGEAVTIGTAGALVGIGVSIAFTRILGDAYASTAIITGPMLAGAFGGLLITLALTIIPALQASSIPAAEALRYE